MTDAGRPGPEHGRSYGDIIAAKFKKNKTAVVALWLIGALILLAIYTPLISNDRPYAFYGTVSELYRKSFSELVGPAHITLRTAPKKYAAATAKINDDEAGTLLFLKEFMDRADTNLLNDDFLNFREGTEDDDPPTVVERMGRNHPLRGAVKSLQISFMEFRSLLETDEERAAFEGILQRARARVKTIFEERVNRNRAGVRNKFDELVSQLSPEAAAPATGFAARYDALTKGDYLNAKPDLEAFKKLRKEVRAAFDPKGVTLVPHWRFPLFQSLHPLDALFMVAGSAWLLVFWLPWSKLRRIQPRGRRWLIQWALVAAPALCSAVGWAIFHQDKLDRVEYKAWSGEGKMQIQSSYWPPHRFHQGELIAGIERKEKPPSLSNPAGLDFIGRDLMARLLWGARISLSVGFVSTGIALTLGLIVGSAAGYFGGWVDWILLRVIEVWICFPYFFVILALSAFLPSENRIYYIMVALGLFQWMTIARLTRGEFLRLRKQEFVIAAQALGARGRRVIFRHVLPNAIAPVLIAASFGIAGAILAESGLSFLGFGVEEPDVSWGKVLNAAADQPKTWWPLVFPGLCIFLSITCYNLIGDAVRDAVDPRLRVE